MDTASLSPPPTLIDAEALMTSFPVLETKMEAEFKRLPVSPVFSTSIANARGVSKKNRWKEHVPFDHNRVILTSEEYTSSLNDDKDYINASFIRGFSSNGGYIATQGPMLGTVEDFWRMVWSENSHVIAMMSRTVEGYQTRGYKYWPDPGDSLEASHVVVTTDWEDERATHAIRKFVMRDGTTGETRTVTQLQFLCWPEDSSCLPCISTFVAFWNVFRRILKDDRRLPVVHCSNGSHRSSLLIALDTLCQQLTSKGTVDVFNAVRRLREDRTGSIDSLDQYIFLHYCLVEVCSGFQTSVCLDQGHVKTEATSTPDKPPASRTYSLDVFKNIQLNRVIRERFQDNLANTNTSLEDGVLPGDDVSTKHEQHSALIGSHRSTRHQWISSRQKAKSTREAGRDVTAKQKSAEEIGQEYKMNRSAVTTTTIPETAPSRLKHSLSLQDTKIMSEISGILPAESKKSFLVTSFMHLMSSDFWQVLFDTGCQTVIRILPDRKNEQITSKIPSQFSQVEDQTIKILSLSGLPVDCHSVPCDLLLYLFQLMDTWLDQSSTSLVNVQCSDGMANCGFLCAAYNVMSNLVAGEDADVYLTSRVVQSKIPDAITQEQYRQLYQVCEQCGHDVQFGQSSNKQHPSIKDKARGHYTLDNTSSLESSSSTD